MDYKLPVTHISVLKMPELDTKWMVTFEGPPWIVWQESYASHDFVIKFHFHVNLFQ